MVEKISVSPPTLPMYMRNISIMRETIPSDGVIPRVSPTVPMAEAVSNMQVIMGSFSITVMTTPPVRKSATYIVTIAIALRMTLSAMLLPAKLG